MKREVTITHRGQGRGYLLVIEGVQETILMSAEDLAFLSAWGVEHYQELEQEIQDEQNEIARRLLEDK